jgi:hypothetical protein
MLPVLLCALGQSCPSECCTEAQRGLAYRDGLRSLKMLVPDGPAPAPITALAAAPLDAPAAAPAISPVPPGDFGFGALACRVAIVFQAGALALS